MNRLTIIAGHVDAFCARLNNGLAAVAILLAILLAIGVATLHPDYFLPPVDAETSVTLG